MSGYVPIEVLVHWSSSGGLPAPFSCCCWYAQGHRYVILPILSHRNIRFLAIFLPCALISFLGRKNIFIFGEMNVRRSVVNCIHIFFPLILSIWNIFCKNLVNWDGSTSLQSSFTVREHVGSKWFRTETSFPRNHIFDRIEWICVARYYCILNYSGILAHHGIHFFFGLHNVLSREGSALQTNRKRLPPSRPWL